MDDDEKEQLEKVNKSRRQKNKIAKKTLHPRDKDGKVQWADMVNEEPKTEQNKQMTNNNDSE